MMVEEMYTRQESLELHVPKSVTIVGLGGTGSWAAIYCAMSGVKELVLIDDDVIELSNLNRLPFSTEAIGRYKVNAVADFVWGLRDDIRTESHRLKITSDNMAMIRTEACICCTDKLQSQQEINAYCRKNNIQYQRSGYDGTILNVSRATPLTFETGEDHGGYTVTPSWSVPASVSAALACYSLMKQELHIMDDISKLNTGTSCLAKHVVDTVRTRAYGEGKDDVFERAYVFGLGKCNDCHEWKRGYDTGFSKARGQMQMLVSYIRAGRDIIAELQAELAKTKKELEEAKCQELEKVSIAETA